MKEVMKQSGIGKRKMAKACMKQEDIIHFSPLYHCIRNFCQQCSKRIELDF